MLPLLIKFVDKTVVSGPCLEGQCDESFSQQQNDCVLQVIRLLLDSLSQFNSFVLRAYIPYTGSIPC